MIRNVSDSQFGRLTRLSTQAARQCRPTQVESLAVEQQFGVIDMNARMVLGSTAEVVAREARCPVAVVRGEPAESDSGYVAVVVDDSPGNDAVLEQGFREARLRGAPILALGVWRWGLGEIPYQQLSHRLGRWASRYSEVHVMPAAARRGAAEFLTRTQEPVRLAVVGSPDAGELARIVGPPGQHLFGRAGCSVLVAR